MLTHSEYLSQLTCHMHFQFHQSYKSFRLHWIYGIKVFRRILFRGHFNFVSFGVKNSANLEAILNDIFSNFCVPRIRINFHGLEHLDFVFELFFSVSSKTCFASQMIVIWFFQTIEWWAGWSLADVLAWRKTYLMRYQFAISFCAAQSWWIL